MKALRLAYLLLLLTCLLPGSGSSQSTPPATPPPQARTRVPEAIRTEFADVMGQVPSEDDESCDRPKARELLRRAWALTGEWVAAFLDKRPDASADQLVAQANTLSYQRRLSKSEIYDEELAMRGQQTSDVPAYRTTALETSAVRLRRGPAAAYAVAARTFGTGTFFIVARLPGGAFRDVWNVTDIAAERYKPGEFDQIGYWAYLAHGINDGALIGDVHSLPATHTGLPRFYVDATTIPAMGCTYPKQLSVWEWNGSAAVPELIETYTATCDTPPLKLEGNLFMVPTKESLKVLGTCGGCVTPVGLWTVRVTPAGVDDLGHVFVDPLYPLIDDLLDRTAHGKDVSDIAAPQVAAALRESFASSAATPKPDYCPSADLMGWKLTHGSERDLLEVSMEGSCGGPGQLSLEIQYRDGKPYVAAGSIK